MKQNALLQRATNFVLLLALILFTQTIYGWSPDAQKDTLIDKIAALPGVSDVKSLNPGPFNNKYVLFVEQPIDHKNPNAGSFKQRVFLMNISFDRPTVIVTEGYGASYAGFPFYREELSSIFNTNIVFVEHRYFLESKPENVGWEHLTAENSANDLHRVRELFGTYYKNKWIATGISKGGQTSLIYRAFFPNDVDITVPYVAPLCKGKEDGRHEPFLANFAGTKEQRSILQNFQRELLSRRDELQPKFDSLCNAKKLIFTLPLNNIYDYSVLEFPFAFWQWGSPFAKIPDLGSSADEIFKYWMTISGPDYFVNESDTTPFFIQAAKELGYYGYDTKPFKGLLSIKSSKGYLDKLFLPKETKLKFDKTLYKKLKRFVASTDSKILFVYGEFDPWSAVMVSEPKSKNVVLCVEPGGSHRARISTLPEEMKHRAISTIQTWLQE